MYCFFAASLAVKCSRSTCAQKDGPVLFLLGKVENVMPCQIGACAARGMTLR